MLWAQWMVGRWSSYDVSICPSSRQVTVISVTVWVPDASSLCTL